jgi:hypothetical protein
MALYLVVFWLPLGQHSSLRLCAFAGNFMFSLQR